MSNIVSACDILSATNALRRVGWWSGDNMVCGDLLPDLRSELIELAREERLEQAGVGRESDFHIDHDVRGDRIFWLTRQRSVQRRLLDRLEELRLDLNRELFLGLFEFEGHLAHFPPGTFYRRHLDSFRGAANRIVSVTIYLNENWQLGDGGELVLYRPDSDIEMARIEPRAGTIALFLSEEIPHEVLPSRIHRASIAGWFRLNNTTASYIDPPR